MSDLISRRAAIDAIWHSVGSENGELQSFAEAVIADAEEEIKALPSAQPGWIPCSERLPEKDTHFYLTTIANHGLNFTTTLPDDVDVVRWDYDRRKGQNSWHWCTERTVIAWQPLPEPYKEAEE